MKDHAAVALIAFAVMLLACCTSCASQPADHPCSEPAADAIMVGAKAAVDHLKASGACDAYPEFTDCPDYKVIRAAAELALTEGACK